MIKFQSAADGIVCMAMAALLMLTTFELITIEQNPVSAVAEASAVQDKAAA